MSVIKRLFRRIRHEYIRVSFKRINRAWFVIAVMCSYIIVFSMGKFEQLSYSFATKNDFVNKSSLLNISEGEEESLLFEFDIPDGNLNLEYEEILEAIKNMKSNGMKDNNDYYYDEIEKGDVQRLRLADKIYRNPNLENYDDFLELNDDSYLQKKSSMTEKKKFESPYKHNDKIQYLEQLYTEKNRLKVKRNSTYFPVDDLSNDFQWSARSFFSKLEKISTRCHKLVRFGGRNSCGYIDGHKFICLDPDVTPKLINPSKYKCNNEIDKLNGLSKNKYLIKYRERRRDEIPSTRHERFDDFFPSDHSYSPQSCSTVDDARCIVYSFGVGNDLSFDKSMVEYGCKGYAFDMTLRNDTNQQVKRNLHFLSLGLANETFNMNLKIMDGTEKDRSKAKVDLEKMASVRTLTDIRNILDHRNREIDVLKLDIEHNEWSVFSAMLKQKENPLQNVKQIAIEVHLDELRNSSLSTVMEWTQTYDKVLDGLHGLGYRLAYTFLNEFGQEYVALQGKTYPLFRESLFVYRPHEMGDPL